MCSARDDIHRDQQPERIDNPERLAARDLLPRVITPGLSGHGRRATHAASINNPHGGLGFASMSSADQRVEPRYDPLPCPVPRPREMVPVHRVPMRILLGQRPPLTARRSHIQNRVNDPPPIIMNRATHRPVPRIRRHQITDQRPFLVAKIALRTPPRTQNKTPSQADQLSIGHRTTERSQNHTYTAQIFTTALR